MTLHNHPFTTTAVKNRDEKKDKKKHQVLKFSYPPCSHSSTKQRNLNGKTPHKTGNKALKERRIPFFLEFVGAVLDFGGTLLKTQGAKRYGGIHTDR